MNRRTLLISTSVVAIAAALPSVPVGAMAPIPTLNSAAKLILIEEALDAAERMGFSIPAQGFLFGLPTHQVESIDELRTLMRRFVIKHGAIGVWNRVRFVVAIDQQLTKPDLFSGPQHIRHFLDAPRSNSEHSLRELMLGYEYDLYQVARGMGSDVEFHGFTEMRAFS